MSRYEYPLDEEQREFLTCSLSFKCDECGAPVGFQCMSEAGRYPSEQHDTRTRRGISLWHGKIAAPNDREPPSGKDDVSSRVRILEESMAMLYEKLGIGK